MCVGLDFYGGGSNKGLGNLTKEAGDRLVQNGVQLTNVIGSTE